MRTLGALAALALTVVLAAACSGGDKKPPPEATGDRSQSTPAQTARPRLPPPRPGDPFREGEARVAEALGDDFKKTDFTRRIVDLTEIREVLSRDSIPAIMRPRFVAQRQADEWLDGAEPVIALSIGTEARAYPLQVLTWHEIVNDTLGGRPVIVTFCPLCNTAITFDRRVAGGERTFGVSGALRRSDLVMYDQQSETLWQQISGEALVGAEVGARLELLPSQIVSYAEFKAAFPTAQVLSRETGFPRPYGRNPYFLYDSDPQTLFPVDEFNDPRLDAKERVLTVELGGESVAFPFRVLTKRPVVTATVGGTDVVAFWQPGAVSALDQEFIIGSRNVGSAGAFLPTVNGERLTFEAREGKIVDTKTGSQWDVLGRALSGPLAGARLTPVVSGNHFWFAWVVFQPQTRIVGG